MDRPFTQNRGGILLTASLIGLILSLVFLTLQSYFFPSVHLSIIIFLFAAEASFSTPPYVLTTVFTLHLGGKKGVATLSALNDGVGYLGSALSGLIVGSLSTTENGWGNIFLMLVILSLITAFVMIFYYYCYEKKNQSTSQYSLFINEEQTQQD